MLKRKTWVGRSHWLSAFMCAAVAGGLLEGCSAHGVVEPVRLPAVSTDQAGVTPHFTDVTAKAGINYAFRAPHTNRKYLVETMGVGGGFIDYDGDGNPDLILLSPTAQPSEANISKNNLQLYHNDGNGHFTNVTRASGLDKYGMMGMGIAVGDYDNDGRQDFYVTSAIGPGHLFHNDGGGRFHDVASEAGVQNLPNWGTSCAWVDYDRDGLLDLFICNYVKYASLKDDQPCFSGANHEMVYCVPSAYDRSHCTLYRNMGGGRFMDVSKASGIADAKGKSLGVCVWDYDNDGYPDIFVANDTVAGFVFHNQHNGTFKEVGVESGIAYNEEGIPHSGMGIDAAATSATGDTSVVLTNYLGQQTSFYNQVHDGVFEDNRAAAGIGPATAAVLGFGILFTDYDNDGLPDIVQVDGHVQDDIQVREPQVTYAEPTLMFRNMSNGTYKEVGLGSGSPFTNKVVGRGLASADYDQDGREDLLITSNTQQAQLWHNVTPTHNHWLTVTLRGVRSNRSGIGATLIAEAGGKQYRSAVRSGFSYLSASELAAHFGLGSSATGVNLTVKWPSGATDFIRGVPMDRRVTVVEGSGVAK